VKVLQIYKDYYPPVQGGIERHVSLLANGLKQKGVDVTVLVSNRRPSYEETTVEGIRVIKAPQLFRLFSAPVNTSMASLLWRFGSAADILHFHLPNPTADMAFLFSGLSDRKVVATYHSDIVRQKFLNKLYIPFFRIFLKKANAIIVTSPNYAESSKYLQPYKNKCHIVPLGINLARFQTECRNDEIHCIRRRYGSEIVLFIGKFRYYKGLDVLIRAMHKTRGNLLLIGSGPFELHLRRLVSSLNMENRVFFLGECDDDEVNAYLKACDVFVLPSILRSEAFGLAQLEAMACGKPVISTELGTGTSYVNQDKATGIIVPPSDTAALAESIDRLIGDPILCRKLGEAGSIRVRKHFSEEQMIDGTMQLYQQILCKTSRNEECAIL
jgi:rhamnosyl/mannosyltransferase